MFSLFYGCESGYLTNEQRDCGQSLLKTVVRQVNKTDPQYLLTVQHISAVIGEEC